MTTSQSREDTEIIVRHPAISPLCNIVDPALDANAPQRLFESCWTGPLTLKQNPNALDQLVGIDRLSDIGVKRRLPLGEICRHDHHLDLGPVLPDALGKLYSIHRAQWHCDIDDQKMDVNGAEHVHRLVGMGGFNDIVASAPELICYHHANEYFVFHDQNADRRFNGGHIVAGWG